MLRLFKTFNAQPRLGVVTRTLSRSANDMAHFGLVFMTIFVSFIVSGHVLFGQDLDDFATFDRAFVTCFRCMMGDFDWEEMEQVGREQAGVWFFLFLILVNLIMLNILLAILMEAYGRVMTDAMASYPRNQIMSLPDQVKKIWHRWRSHRNGKSVSLKGIKKSFEQTDGSISEDPLYPQKLKDLVQGIPENQAEEIFRDAWEKNADEKKQPVNEEDLKDALKKLREEIERCAENSAPNSDQLWRPVRGADPKVTMPFRRTSKSGWKNSKSAWIASASPWKGAWARWRRS